MKKFVFAVLVIVVVFAPSAFAEGPCPAGEPVITEIGVPSPISEVERRAGKAQPTGSPMTVVTLPKFWNVVSVQRHAVPLQMSLDVQTSHSTARFIIDSLNKASERDSHLYTVTFRSTAGCLETRTLKFPHEKVRFVTNKDSW